MRVDQTLNVTLARAFVPMAIIVAAPVLLVAGAPIHRRYLRHVHRDDAPALVDKPMGRVSVHYFVVNSRLLHWLCLPTETLSRRARAGRARAGRAARRRPPA
ncbi:hypothetical protein [Streptomyces sp. AM8-1-1]|uniref:hypothetical protein n=1 Tax=Streptomyces sp. AM8-1-1 TaxID=3075825 RepID=UPI0028C4437B|nr:hypothetical protein [Streptomyces sp. AM8-1-1]WNO70648.1 hypothetical protein RPQ07_02960 [Streptomyces sp. AM8-1-1]